MPNGAAQTTVDGRMAENVRAQPPRGTAVLRYQHGLVSIDAFAAPRRPLLEDLARQAGFDVEAPPGPWPPLTLRIDDVPLELALPRVVGDFAYSVEWRPDHSTHRLAKLTIGGPQPPRDPAPEDHVLPPGEVAASLDRAIATLGAQPLSEADAQAAAARFADVDPEVRVRAALALEPEGEQLEKLCDLLAHDPDPRVRAAATASLENSGDFTAVRALVDALGDHDPEVVVEVIDSLEYAGDPTVTRNLEPLLAHDDPRVRQAAADAIEYFGK